MNSYKLIRLKWAVSWLLLASGCTHLPPSAGPTGGRIIAFGGFDWGTPPPQVIQEHVKAWDALPLDGLVFDLSTSGNLHVTCLDLEKPWDPAPVRDGVAIMKSLPLHHLRHNYARLNTTSIRADWFDDQAWAELVQRFGTFAKAAHDSGAAGIMLDTELYPYSHNQPQFWYAKQAHRSEYSFAEYNAKARQRGAEVMRAVRQNFPGVDLYLTYGPSYAQYEMRAHIELSQAYMGLMTGFFDGFLQESKGCRVTDGWELAYGYHTDDEFARAEDLIRNQTAKLSADPRLYRQRTKVGFGVWPEKSGTVFNRSDFSKNGDTPAELEYALHYALRHSDGVVWVYGESFCWTGTKHWPPAPPEYLDAIRNARAPHPGVYPGRAGAEADQTIFASLYATHTELFDFPKPWRLRTDPNNVGVAEKWFALESVSDGWKPANIREYWGGAYLGYAWYRVEFNVPAAWLKDPLILAFGAVDERAWVYLNGQLVCDHSQGDPGVLCDQPFQCDIRSYARRGRNVLVVRVHNSVGAGGIWRGVKLFGLK